MRLIYIRHAEPIYNPDSLTENGKMQASKLAAYVKDMHIDQIYASSHNRAMMTASEIATSHHLDITPLDWAREDRIFEEFGVDDNGRWNWCFVASKTRSLFRLEEVSKLGDEWFNHPVFKDYSFKEGILRVNKEVDKFFESLGYRHDRGKKVYYEERISDNTVFFVAHSGFGMAFLSSVLDIPYNKYCTEHDQVNLCSITEIEFKAENGIVKPKIIRYSDDSYLK